MAEVITDLDLLIPAEQCHLDAAKAVSETFNIATDIVSPGRGRVHSQLARQKMSAAGLAAITPELLESRRERMTGEQNPAGKLTEPDVLGIVQRLIAGEHPVALAMEAGVSERLIYLIRDGKNWAHLITAEQVSANAGTAPERLG